MSRRGTGWHDVDDQRRPSQLTCARDDGYADSSKQDERERVERPVDELEQAERALAEAKKQAEEHAAMASLELHAAVVGGPSHAKDLLDYHIHLWDLSRTMTARYLRVCQLREAQGLPPIERHFEIVPDYGPMPVPAPGENTLTGKPALWALLFGSLNGRNLDGVTRCLRELEGWTPHMAA